MGPWDKLLRHDDYELMLDGVSLLVKDHVFTPDPAITYSTRMLLNTLPDVRGKTILDIGTGTGIVAIVCARKGAKHVVASDSDLRAVENAAFNVGRNNLADKVTVIQSDLFENTPEKFDYAFANLPILDEVWGEKGAVKRLYKRFLREAKDHLTPAGKTYFTWASFADVEVPKAVCASLGYAYKLHSQEAQGFEWYVFEM